MDKENIKEMAEKVLSGPMDDPFLDGNDCIVTAINDYFAKPSDEALAEVLEAIRSRMNENGHFLIPVTVDPAGIEKGFAFRTLDLKDQKHAYPVFTSREEFEKGPKSEILSYFINEVLQMIMNSEEEGLIINPWGKPFVLPKTLINLIFMENDEDPKAVVGKKFKQSDLEDGILLKDAIGKFNEKQTLPLLLILLQLLRDSYVYVPCTAVLGDQDQAAMRKMVEEAKKDGNSLEGKQFTTEESVRFIPDILHNEEEYFFPVFTTEEEMGEYGEHFSKVGQHILDVLPLAESSEKDVVGLVINPFTDACVIDKELFGTIRKMDSKVEEEKNSKQGS